MHTKGSLTGSKMKSNAENIIQFKSIKGKGKKKARLPFLTSKQEKPLNLKKIPQTHNQGFFHKHTQPKTLTAATNG